MGRLVVPFAPEVVLSALELLYSLRRLESSSRVTEDAGEWLVDDLGEVEVRSTRLCLSSTLMDETRSPAGFGVVGVVGVEVVSEVVVAVAPDVVSDALFCFLILSISSSLLVCRDVLRWAGVVGGLGSVGCAGLGGSSFFLVFSWSRSWNRFMTRGES